jgi:hypothetical protein
MAEPDWNPDTGGRSLAEILREAGIEAPRSGRRRRWDDPADTGIRQRGSGGAPPEGRPSFGRRRSDLEAAEPAPARERRPVPEPSTAAIPGLRPERTPGVPGASAQATATPVRERRPTERGAPERGAPERETADRRAPERETSDRRAAERRPGERRGGERPDRRPADGADRRADGHPDRRAPGTERTAERTRTQAGEQDEHFSTGRIPVVRPEDLEEEASPRESALAWLRFAGELVIALAAGVGIYFLFNVLWENLPYLAVLLAPFAVTALVGGVTFWRQRMGREPVGAKLLVVLVFAGTLLTIVPAAQLLNP